MIATADTEAERQRAVLASSFYHQRDLALPVRLRIGIFKEALERAIAAEKK